MCKYNLGMIVLLVVFILGALWYQEYLLASLDFLLLAWTLYVSYKRRRS